VIATDIFEAERLILRPVRPTDHDRVQGLIDDYDVAANTMSIPHPLPEGHAATWLHRGDDNPDSFLFIVALKSDDLPIGTIGLHRDAENLSGTIGYLIGRDYRNAGYATEALRRIIRFGFETLGLNRIEADHFTRNPASGRVMHKAGMKCEGVLRQHIFKWNVLEDIAVYSILREEYIKL
jgi:[ribosomal protein S5]-alanine N-acetyltransferase